MASITHTFTKSNICPYCGFEMHSLLNKPEFYCPDCVKSFALTKYDMHEIKASKLALAKYHVEVFALKTVRYIRNKITK